MTSKSKSKSKPGPKKRNNRIIDAYPITFGVRINESTRDGLNAIAAAGGMNCQQLVRAVFQGMVDSFAQAAEMARTNPQLFDKYENSMNAALDRAVVGAKELPPLRARKAGRSIIDASGIKPQRPSAP